MPKLPTPFKSYVYCTKSDGNVCYPDGSYHCLGKVPFEYVCDYIKVIQALPGRNKYDISADDLKQTHLLQEELWEYGKGKPLYLWHISDLKIYDKPKELSEFHKPCINPGMRICELCEFADFENTDVLHPKCINILICPPQSWCYVEEGQ